MSRLKHPKVVKVSNDGKHVTVKFILNGEEVEGAYSLYLWNQAPTPVNQRFHEAQRNGPVAWMGAKGPGQA
jgi:hypothetical protein